MKKVLILLTFVFAVTSCKKDFLEEDTKAVASPESFYTTSNGLDKLVTACYVSNKVWYGKEEGFDFSEVGTDTYTAGQQNANMPLAIYDNSFNSFNGKNTILWVEFYKAINACNTAIKYLSDASHPMTSNLKAIRKAEALFLRAHNLWLLTETWGSVPMPLEPTGATASSRATRASIKEIYKQIVADLRAAGDLMPATSNMAAADFGRVTKDAILGFRARIYLTMASKIKHGGNVEGLEGDAGIFYGEAKKDAEAVIATGKYSFYANYNDLWSLNNNAGGKNTEGIWAVNYSRGTNALMGGPELTTEYAGYNNIGGKAFDQREGGHHGHLMFNTQYDVWPGMVRDLTYGRPFVRYAPNKYLLDAYNTALDARYEGQFRTTWVSNNPASIPKWSSFVLGANPIPGGKAPSDPIYAAGDTAAVITIKDIDDSRVVYNASGSMALYLDGPYLIWDNNVLFKPDGTYNNSTSGLKSIFNSLKKFEDAGRAAIATQNGGRDSYVLRIAEMYLIAAEAGMELGTGGYAHLKTLADSRAINKNGTALLASYGINSDADITVEKILDERAREFPGEQLRWFDLKRLHTPAGFIARIQKYNPDTKAMKDYHYYRPIPQVQLDAIENATEFGQNFGY